MESGREALRERREVASLPQAFICRWAWKRMSIRGIKLAEMTTVVNLAKRTFYARLACPTRFTLGEIDTMARKLHLESREL